MIAAYVRVSSKSQDGKTQRSSIERAARARKDKIAAWYLDKKGGETLNRPELNRLRHDIRLGKVTKLYVFRLDRLSRGGIPDTFRIVNELRSHHVQIVNVADDYRFDSPEGELLLAFFAWLAKMDRQRIGENIAAARVRVEAAGGRWGRPPRVPPAQQELVRKLKAQDFTVREIAIKLKIPYATVSKVLCRKGAYARRPSTPGKPGAEKR